MLGKRERKQLEKLLASTGAPPEEIFNTYQLEGFLFGVVITPEPILPIEWTSVVIGESLGGFDSPEKAERLLDALVKAHDKFCGLRLAGKLPFPYDIEKIDDRSLQELIDWVVGFDYALDMRPDIWGEELAPEAGGEEELDMDTSLAVIEGIVDPDEGREIVEALQLPWFEGGGDGEVIGALLLLVPLAVAAIENFAAARGDRREGGKKVKKSRKGERSEPAQGSLFEFPSVEKAEPPTLPPLRAEALVELQKLAVSVGRDLERGADPGVGPLEEAFVTENPAAALALVDILAGCAPSEGEDGPFYGALYLLRILCEHLRGALERGYEGIDERIANLQGHIADRIFRADVDLGVGAGVVRDLQESQLEILPVLREAHLEMVERMGEEGRLPGGDFDPSQFLDFFAENGCSSPFEGLDFLLDQIGLFDPEVQLGMARSFADSEYPILRDIAGLMILHPQLEVSREVPSLLAGGVLSPETLRRFILARNWLPEAQRPDLDRCIQMARKSGVECAPLKAGRVDEIYASPLDGAGAQGFWIVGKGEGGIRVRSILWKQSEGIVAAWSRDMSDAEAEEIVGVLRHETSAIRVERWYLDKAVSHALHLGLAIGKVPPVGLLEVAEGIGASNWHAAPLDLETEMKRLIEKTGDLSRSVFGKANIKKVVEESFDWIRTKDFTDSWFEDDASVFKVLKKKVGNPRKWEASYPKAIGVVLSEILEPKREVWTERLVWTTLWLLANPGRSPLLWHKMLVVTRELFEGRPMKEAPLMVGIAEATLFATLERGR